MGAIPRARKLRPILRAAHVLNLAAAVRLAFWALPRPVMAAALHRVWWLRGKASLAAQERGLWLAMVEHVQLGVLGRALAVALGATDAVGAPGAWLAALRRRGPAVSLHFAEGDGWTPVQARAALSHHDCLPQA